MSQSVVSWMILPLQRYADFRGRSRRSEFWWWTLAYLIVNVILLAIMFSGLPWDFANSDPGQPPANESASNPLEFFGPGLWIGSIGYFIFFFGTIIPNLAVTVRRLHDRGL